MELSTRPRPYLVPPYSLTGDLLSFKRCGLQYRMQGIGQLPSTRPVQMWFGQFVHGVLEEAYRRYKEHRSAAGAPFTPPPAKELQDICALVARRLAAGGLRARSADVERAGQERVKAAIHDLAPALFPVINQAEVRLTGTRPFPTGLEKKDRTRDADRYEMKGVVDVITHIELNDNRLKRNWLVKALLDAVPTVTEAFEVIVDYKGMRRPPRLTGNDLSSIYEWQLQTYAKLRSVQQDSLPVTAGVLIYLNELQPTWTDLRTLREEIRRGEADVTPDQGSAAERIIEESPSRSKHRTPYPQLPLDFRRRRALRIVAISPGSQEEAASKFDEVVAEIERGRAKEQASGKVLRSWPRNIKDEATCAACDWRTECPSFSRKSGITAPRPPGATTVRTL